MTAKRVDANQPSIVADLRRIGATVHHLHTIGRGCPDILVGFRGLNYLFEIKTPRIDLFDVKSRQTHLTAKQRDWHDTWEGQVAVIRSLEDALAVMAVDRNQTNLL